MICIVRKYGSTRHFSRINPNGISGRSRCRRYVPDSRKRSRYLLQHRWQVVHVSQSGIRAESPAGSELRIGAADRSAVHGEQGKL